MDEEELTPDELAYREFCEAEFTRLTTTPMPVDMKVSSDEGEEGPRHDPYGWSEYSVTMPDGRSIRYRTGMIEELWVDGVEVARGGGWGSGDREIRSKFEELVGFPIDQVEYWAEEQYRFPCMACGRESGCRGRCME